MMDYYAVPHFAIPPQDSVGVSPSLSFTGETIGNIPRPLFVKPHSTSFHLTVTSNSSVSLHFVRPCLISFGCYEDSRSLVQIRVCVAPSSRPCLLLFLGRWWESNCGERVGSYLFVLLTRIYRYLLVALYQLCPEDALHTPR